MCQMTPTKRTWLFALVCVSVRIAIATLTHTVLPNIAHHVGGGAWSVPYFLVSVGFLRNTLREKPIGFFGGEAWWASNRKYHAFLWFVAAVLVALTLDVTYEVAAVLLYVDVAIGVGTRITLHCDVTK